MDPGGAGEDRLSGGCRRGSAGWATASARGWAWPLLNALLNTSAGATWVSIHHGGGVGIGRSIHAGMVVVADGSELASQPTRSRARPHRRSSTTFRICEA